MDQSISRFWEKYIDKSKVYGVKPHLLKWYIRHAETYIKAHKQVRLVTHTPELVEQYLRDKGRNTRQQDWQFKQIIDALKILFVEVLLSRTPTLKKPETFIIINGLNNLLRMGVRFVSRLEKSQYCT